jgi:hypothetical protein
LIIFTASTPSISVYTTSSSYDGTTYTLKIIGTVTGFTTSNFATFTLNILSICTITTLTSNTIPNYRYDISDGTL